MQQNWKCFVALLLTCSITAQSTECRLLQEDSQGATVRFTEIPAAGRSCSTVCPSPLLFVNAFKTQPASYACIAQGSSGAVGFQSGTGSSTCTTASGGQAAESTDYSCLCLVPSAIPGLAKPDATGSCASSCLPFAGETGSPISANGGSLCMAMAEAGSTNHFGLVSGGQCTYISGQAVAQTPSFSCICAYGGAASSSGSQTAAGATPFQIPQAQIQTAG